MTDTCRDPLDRVEPKDLAQIALQMLFTIERMELIIPEITDTIRKALEQARPTVEPVPEPPADKEVTELVAWLRDRASSTSLAHTARRITRAADLLERLASDNAGLAAAADSLYADNMSLLDNHHE
jgi:hypothetical protein